MNKFLNYYNPFCTGAGAPAVFYNDPYVAAIKELLIFELQQVVYYIEKLKEFNMDMKIYTDKVIEFISVLIVKLDFKKESFFVIANDLYDNKKALRNMYISISEKEGKTYELLNELDLSSKENILKALNDKESNIQNKTALEVNKNKKNLYEIIINLVLNACNCLIELKNYNENFEEAKNQVLKLLNSSNFPAHNEEKLIKIIKDFSKCSYKIMKKLYEAERKKYGPVIKKEVCIGQRKGKGILVSGTGLSDLEKILLAAKNFGINVYTHSGMINAFKYEKFLQFKNLVCHYKKSNNNFPLDFASFSGPVFISNNSIFKAEAVRGRIYTSAKYPAYGTAGIKNNDFTPIIEYADNTEGFDKDETYETINIGYDTKDINNIIEQIIEKFDNKTVDRLFIIGEIEYFGNKDRYLEKFIKSQPENSCIIVFSSITTHKKDNLFKIDTYCDFELLYNIIEELEKNNPQIKEKTAIFLTDCNNNTISHIFNLISLNIKDIFLGSCCSSRMNPVLTEGLKDLFNIKSLSAPEQDILNTG